MRGMMAYFCSGEFAGQTLDIQLESMRHRGLLKISVGITRMKNTA